MITFVVTGEHAYTVGPLKKGFGIPVPEVASISYADLSREESLPSGTYIFSDLERLSDTELRWASELYRCVKASPGSRALNDPARVRVRYGLLRALHAAGVNSFDAYRADGAPRPARFPVFVRRQADHDAALSGLLPDQEALDACLEELMAKGESLRGLVVIEFCAEPVRPGIYRRYGAFRVADAIHLDHVVTQDNWNVKGGAPGFATEDMYRQDDRDIRANRYADVMRRTFDIAGIDYGRADFGIVDGRPQVYEINTNPSMSLPPKHPSKTRSATLQFARERFAELLWRIDSPADGRRIALDSPRLVSFRGSGRNGIEWIRELERDRAALRASVKLLEGRIADMRESTSWRVTAPLRRAIEGWRRLRKPPS
jgi:hypothetical protein